MIGVLIGRLKGVRPETRVSALYAVPAALTLLLHGVHMLLVSAAAAGAAGLELHMHDHSMAGMAAPHGTSQSYDGAMLWMTVPVMLLNICGCYFAVTMLWRVWRTKLRDRHAVLCCTIAIGSLAVAIGSAGMLL